MDDSDAMFAFLALTDGIPVSYKEAMNSSDCERWRDAMKKELGKMEKLGVYELKKKTERRETSSKIDGYLKRI